MIFSIDFKGKHSNEPVDHRRNDTTAAFNNFLEKRASTITDESQVNRDLYANMQPALNRVDNHSTRM
jgi:hypothetical protein